MNVHKDDVGDEVLISNPLINMYGMIFIVTRIIINEHPTTGDEFFDYELMDGSGNEVTISEDNICLVPAKGETDEDRFDRAMSIL